MRKALIFLLCFSIISGSCLCFAVGPEISSPAAVLIERDTGTILFEKGSHDKLPPASVTKVMTLLLVMEALDSGKISITDTVTVSAHAASMGGSQVFLEQGEQMSLDDMLKATVVSSGNDSAVALAEHIAGSEEGFVALMNARAKELGMNDTNFVNCTGLDAEGHLTSAHDIAIMSAELLKHAKIKDYTTIWMDTIRNGEFQLANTNKLLRTYNGITGLKTGSTSVAKYCMAASAERDGMELVAAIMAAPTSAERFSDAASVLNYGFANYTLYDAEKDLSLSPVPVILGRDESVTLKLSDNGKVLVSKGDISNLKTEVSLCENVKAPVEVNQTLGSLKILNGDAVVKEIPIIASVSVEKLKVSDIFWKLMSHCFMQ